MTVHDQLDALLSSATAVADNLQRHPFLAADAAAFHQAMGWPRDQLVVALFKQLLEQNRALWLSVAHLAAVVTCLRDGRPIPAVPDSETVARLQALANIEAVFTSLRDGRPMPVVPDNGTASRPRPTLSVVPPANQDDGSAV